MLITDSSTLPSPRKYLVASSAVFVPWRRHTACSSLHRHVAFSYWSICVKIYRLQIKNDYITTPSPDMRLNNRHQKRANDSININTWLLLDFQMVIGVGESLLVLLVISIGSLFDLITPLEHIDFHIIGYWTSNVWSLWHISLQETCVSQHRLLFPISRKGYFICTFPQTG